ncbi:hypothetical protein DB88DRAFT_497461 [Papiliotrema laurentii]|uniref:Methyltransferase domain-containing protein n=1 Tax=Papiliotrema laurentii TaxID=5418 RepID=A0AAD9CWS4_PAPLA|nr:hypothetical protein DB88DRAFT_497461 [Papiliotrema laurentii]
MGDSHGNINHAMRDNYDQFGVDEYYRKVSSSYRNPFLPSIKQVVWALFNTWWDKEGSHLSTESPPKILDMAAGSGEVTSCLLEWVEAGKQGMTQTLNSRAFVPPKLRTRAGPKLPEGFRFETVATDPYTTSAYTARTQLSCYPLSFSDLANGQVPDGVSPPWAFIICSFALHLVPTSSELFALLYELSTKATWLVVISPHKKPEIKESWGWTLWDVEEWKPSDTLTSEVVREKTRLRLFRSTTLL